MRLSELKRLAEQEFGPNLEYATPANVREFLERLQQEALQQSRASQSRYEMPVEHARSFEEIIRDFFARTLEMPEEEAAPLLWLVALELAYAAIELHYSEQLDPLFRSLDD